MCYTPKWIETREGRAASIRIEETVRMHLILVFIIIALGHLNVK